MSQPTTSEAEGFSEEQERTWGQLVASLRRAIAHAVQLDGSLPELMAARAQTEALEATLSGISGAKPVPRFRMPLDRGDPGALLAYSPISGKLNPLSPPVEMSVEDDRLIARVTLGPAYEGGVGFAHGGVVAMIWDQVLAMALVAAGAPGPTSELKVQYVAPTPIGEPLRFEGWMESEDGRRIHARGRCFAGDKLVSEANGVFVHISSMSRKKGFGSAAQRAGRVGERRLKEGQES